jgi:hypothetical protein
MAAVALTLQRPMRVQPFTCSCSTGDVSDSTVLCVMYSPDWPDSKVCNCSSDPTRGWDAGISALHQSFFWGGGPGHGDALSPECTRESSRNQRPELPNAALIPQSDVVADTTSGHIQYSFVSNPLLKHQHAEQYVGKLYQRGTFWGQLIRKPPQAISSRQQLLTAAASAAPNVSGASKSVDPPSGSKLCLPSHGLHRLQFKLLGGGDDSATRHMGTRIWSIWYTSAKRSLVSDMASANP